MSMREGSADAARTGIALARRALLLPSVLTVAVDHLPDGVFCVTAEEVAGCRDHWSAMQEVSAARLPMAAAKAGRVHVFRAEDGAEEHYAIEIGIPDRRRPVLSRLHSACFTGDVLGSLKCDCGPQLRGALNAIGSEGAGVLLYLNQEGRGIGLANKMRAYALQDQGFDTVEANHRLGFEDDERNFRIGAELLSRLGFSAVRLMTNNPRKVAMMEAAGIEVAERVPLILGETDENRAYLATKRDKSGHLL
jgi:GTP cyclohydrolase II